MAVPLNPLVADYYRTRSIYSDPGALVGTYADLPADPGLLAGVARGLVVHRQEGGLFDHVMAEDRLHDDAEVRYVEEILRLIVERDGSSLLEPREVGDRFVGVCRDFVLLHCSFLRHAGIPARMRCGFADYFDPSEHGDHVVTEYWTATHGWRLADPQMADPKIAAAFGLDFDPMDVPRDRFLVAGSAWRAIRAGEADPKTFGHSRPVDPMNGEWFVAQSVRLDVAALNKDEMLLWDIWGIGKDSYREVSDPLRELYDHVAEIAGDEVDFDATRALYAQDERLRVPGSVWSLAPFNGPGQVVLREARPA